MKKIIEDDNGIILEDYDEQIEIVEKKSKKRVAIVLISTVLVIAGLLFGAGALLNNMNKPELDVGEIELGDLYQYLNGDTDDFYYDKENDKYVFSDNFKKAFYKMHDNYYDGFSDGQINYVLYEAFGDDLTDIDDADWVYDILTPPDDMTRDEYIAYIDLELKGNIDTQQVVESTPETNTNTSNNDSKYISEKCGWKVGDVMTSGKGKQMTYLGQDQWKDAEGNTYTATDRGNNTFYLNNNNASNSVAQNNNNNNNNSNNRKGDPNSPYLSERLGYKVGDTMLYRGKQCEYLGENLWVYSSDDYKYKYKLVEDDGQLRLLYYKDTYAINDETPVSERLGYKVGDRIYNTSAWAGVDSGENYREYLGDDIWYQNITGLRHEAYLDENGKLRFDQID